MLPLYVLLALLLSGCVGSWSPQYRPEDDPTRVVCKDAYQAVIDRERLC